MYSFKIPPSVLEKVKELNKANPGLKNAIDALVENPIGKAKPIDTSIFGEYYVNAGHDYAITFDIDQEHKIIEILYVFRRPYLYKLLTKKIDFNAGHAVSS